MHQRPVGAGTVASDWPRAASWADPCPPEKPTRLNRHCESQSVSDSGAGLGAGENSLFWPTRRAPPTGTPKSGLSFPRVCNQPFLSLPFFLQQISFLGGHCRFAKPFLSLLPLFARVRPPACQRVCFSLRVAPSIYFSPRPRRQTLANSAVCALFRLLTFFPARNSSAA